MRMLGTVDRRRGLFVAALTPCHRYARHGHFNYTSDT
jgi:hypothetical protein